MIEEWKKVLVIESKHVLSGRLCVRYREITFPLWDILPRLLQLINPSLRSSLQSAPENTKPAATDLDAQDSFSTQNLMSERASVPLLVWHVWMCIQPAVFSLRNKGHSLSFWTDTKAKVYRCAENTTVPVQVNVLVWGKQISLDRRILAWFFFFACQYHSLFSQFSPFGLTIEPVEPSPGSLPKRHKFHEVGTFPGLSNAMSRKSCAICFRFVSSFLPSHVVILHETLNTHSIENSCAADFISHKLWSPSQYVLNGHWIFVQQRRLEGIFAHVHRSPTFFSVLFRFSCFFWPSTKRLCCCGEIQHSGSVCSGWVKKRQWAVENIRSTQLSEISCGVSYRFVPNALIFL